MPNFAPTSEQTDIVNAALTGEGVKVTAYAGTGKTSTLVLVAEALNRPTAYMAFNRSIADEAEDAFSHRTVEAKTFHSFAYRNIVKGTAYVGRLRMKKVSSRQVAETLGLKDSQFVTNDHGYTLKASTMGYIATQTVARFCQSADTEITAYHVPKQDGLEDAHKAIAAKIVPAAIAIWRDINDPNGYDFTFEHDHYLKMWQLTNPTIYVEVGGHKANGKYGPYLKGASRKKAEVILVDEAQDLNRCKEAIVKGQSAQVIVVGDPNQQIYGFTGAHNAMDSFDTPVSLNLTKSFRFGSEVARVANFFIHLLNADAAPLVGHAPIPSEVVGL